MPDRSYENDSTYHQAVNTLHTTSEKRTDLMKRLLDSNKGVLNLSPTETDRYDAKQLDRACQRLIEDLNSGDFPISSLYTAYLPQDHKDYGTMVNKIENMQKSEAYDEKYGTGGIKVLSGCVKTMTFIGFVVGLGVGIGLGSIPFFFAALGGGLVLGIVMGVGITMGHYSRFEVPNPIQIEPCTIASVSDREMGMGMDMGVALDSIRACDMQVKNPISHDQKNDYDYDNNDSLLCEEDISSESENEIQNNNDFQQS